MRQAITLILSLLLSALLYYIFIAVVGGEKSWEAIQQLEWAGWAAILGLSLLNYGLRFIRWHGYMHWLGHRVPPGHHLLVYIAGFALTTTPGKAGEGVRAIYLARRGVPYSHTVAALFAERLLDLISILLLSLLAIVSFTQYVYWFILPAGLIAAVLWAMHNRTLLTKAQNRVASPKTLVSRILHMLVQAWERAFTLLSWKPLLGGLALGCIAWALEGIALYLIAIQLHVAIEWTLAIGIYAVSILIGALSFVPGGLGSTEAVMALLLKLAGAASAIAVSITLIARIATLWFAVALGLVCLGILETAHHLGLTSTNKQKEKGNVS